MDCELHRRRTLAYRCLGLSILLVVGCMVFEPHAWALQSAQDDGGPGSAAADKAIAAPPADDAAPDAPAQPTAQPPRKIEGIKFVELLISGGWFMVPIVGMSLLMVVFAIERMIALRRRRLMPEELVVELGELAGQPTGFDPDQASQVCEQYPSAASAVVRAMLRRAGRPHAELEHIVAEASERAAERAYSNVRWLNLCTAVTPLMGLLGTVWGMIVAFHQTTQLAPGQDRATQLAEGIYIALVTTLGGLVVAIPSAILAHFFETRIVAVFHEIDELLFNLLPHVERFAERAHLDHEVAADEAFGRQK